MPGYTLILKKNLKHHSPMISKWLYGRLVFLLLMESVNDIISISFISVRSDLTASQQIFDILECHTVLLPHVSPSAPRL